MGSHPEIYYVSGNFLVFNKDHAIQLRRKRIVGQLVGCLPRSPNQIALSGLPCLLSHYAAGMAKELKVASFKRIRPAERISIEDNETKYQSELAITTELARKDFIEKRIRELQQRGIEPSPERIGKFDESKVRLPVLNVPRPDHPSQAVEDVYDVEELLQVNPMKMIVFKDLYRRGFYISSGMKFGSDFLAYLGDPVRYHAQFAVRHVDDLDGLVDLKKTNFSEINSLHRLCHTANKICLLATVHKNPDLDERVAYFRLADREYIMIESGADALIPFQPRLSSSLLSSSKIMTPEESDATFGPHNKSRRT